MGASNSSTMKNKTTTNITNNFMQKMSTNISNTNSAEMSLNQKLNFRAPFATLKDCNLDIRQDQGGKVKATMDSLTQLSEEQKADLSADIANAQKQALEQANSGISMPGTSNESDVENEITTNVENNLEMSISKTIKNMNYSKGSADQEATIDLYGMSCDGSNIKIDQNQVLEVVAENLSETVADSVQSGAAVTKAVNKQTQEVKQTNTGISASGSGGSSSSFFSSGGLVLLVAGGALLSGGLGGSEGGYEEMGGGSDGTLPDEGGFNWTIAIVGFLVLILFIVLLSLLFYIYGPDLPCPGEEDCNKGWEEMQKKKPRIPSDIINKYSNCRIRHRVNGLKPKKFRPNCQSPCAFLQEKATEPGAKFNPTKPLYCLAETIVKTLSGGGGDGEKKEGGENKDETTSAAEDLEAEEGGEEGFEEMDNVVEGFNEHYQ
jgi:hypothetical protein